MSVPAVARAEEPLADVRARLDALGFDALPLVDGAERPKGIVNWRAIALRPDAPTAGDVVAPATVLPLATPLLEAIGAIAEGPVLAVHPSGRLAGIVTAADLADRFGRLAGPFLTIGEIERRLRAILRDRVHPGFLRAALDRLPGGDRDGLEATSLGDAVALWRHFEIADELGDPGLVERIEEARRVRNATMHFHDGSPTAADLAHLDALLDDLRRHAD